LSFIIIIIYHYYYFQKYVAVKRMQINQKVESGGVRKTKLLGPTINYFCERK